MLAFLARAKKAVVGAVGFAVGLAVLLPQDQMPEEWRPWVGLLIAAGTVAGVYGVTNAPAAEPPAEPLPASEKRLPGSF